MLRSTPTALLCLAFATPLLAQKPPTDAERLAAACNQFARDLHGKLATSEQPTASPGSIAIALLMLLPAARGETANEIATMLHLPGDLRDARLHAAASDLLERSGIVAGRERKATDVPPLYLTNDLWVETGYPVLPAYVDVLKRSFSAGEHEIAFAADPEKARKTINTHVGKATHDRIPELIPEGLIDAETRVVLTNALWFKAAWAEPFSKGMTKNAPFALANGQKVDVPTMTKSEATLWGESDRFALVSLAFDTPGIRCELVVPKDGATLDDAETALFDDTFRSLKVEQVRIEVPRFQVRGTHRLKEVLMSLGMKLAFQGGGDFSGMTKRNELRVAEVVHQTWVGVDEEGAEAAAATAVIMKRGSASRPGEPKVFRADRPFAFALRDRNTGLLLFVGRVVDPRQKQA